MVCYMCRGEHAVDSDLLKLVFYFYLYFVAADILLLIYCCCLHCTAITDVHRMNVILTRIGEVRVHVRAVSSLSLSLSLSLSPYCKNVQVIDNIHSL